MTDAFEDNVKHWRSLEAADRRDYYFTSILPEVVEQARTKWTASTYSSHKYDLLISMSGFSPETTILAFKIIRPKSMIIISSERTAESIDKIADHVVGHGADRIPHSMFFHFQCDPTSPLDIYEILKSQIDKIKKKTCIARLQAIIDITGGKKVMSATAALAAWQMDLRICYIDNKYDPVLRQPIPGSEEILLLENPISIYGKEELGKILTIFQNGQFGAAWSRYKDLAERLSEPTLARIMRDLSHLYTLWCDINVTELPPVITKIKEWIVDSHTKRFLSSDIIAKIEKQAYFLEQLILNDRSAQLLCFYLLGRHYHKIGRYDFAGLFFYRTMEGCLRARIEVKYPGFEAKTPDYSLLCNNVEELNTKYSDLYKKNFKKAREASLPVWPLGYLNLAVILQVLNDPILREAGFKDPIPQLNKVAETRNSSVLAHGFKSIPEDDSKGIMRLAERILSSYWRLTVNESSLGKDLHEMYENLRFITFE